MPRLQGKVGVITGGSSGLGKAAALAFAREGAKVVVADISDKGQDTANEIKNTGGDAIFVKTDVSKAADCEKMVKAAIDTYGRLDCAFNNAGVEPCMKPAADCTEAEWDRCMGVNLKGVWLCMKYEIPQMLKLGKGSIVNTSSTAGIVAYENRVDYVTSKFGVIGLSKAAALDYITQGIRVNAICPGTIHTEMLERIWQAHPEMKAKHESFVPMGHLGKPQDIAEGVVWLCSEATEFITGTSLVIDGGWTIK